MNRTLFSCGIKRTVTTRKGQEFDVSATFPRSVKLLRKPVKCDICNESFTAKKYLETHIRFKHSSGARPWNIKTNSRSLICTNEVFFQ